LSGTTAQISEFATLCISSKTTEEKNSCPLDTTLNSDPTLLLHSYSTISNATFQEILLKSASNVTGTNELVELLSNNQDIFLYIRQLTQLMNQSYYFQLQKDQWTYYNDLGMTQGIWHGRVSKKMAAVNSMCYTYGRSKVLIKQRKQKYEQHFQHIQNELNEFMKKAPPQLHVDNNTIINIIDNLIYKDQYQLRVEFERRPIMLHFDAKEHQLVNDFYKSKPRQSEVSPHITQSYSFSFCFRSIQQKSFGKISIRNKRFEAKLFSYNNGCQCKLLQNQLVLFLI